MSSFMGPIGYPVHRVTETRVGYKMKILINEIAKRHGFDESDIELVLKDVGGDEYNTLPPKFLMKRAKILGYVISNENDIVKSFNEIFAQTLLIMCKCIELESCKLRKENIPMQQLIDNQKKRWDSLPLENPEKSMFE